MTNLCWVDSILLAQWGIPHEDEGKLSGLMVVQEMISSLGGQSH